jgi:hypothetical protein
VFPVGVEHEGWCQEDTEVVDIFEPPREDFRRHTGVHARDRGACRSNPPRERFSPLTPSGPRQQNSYFFSRPIAGMCDTSKSEALYEASNYCHCLKVRPYMKQATTATVFAVAVTMLGTSITGAIAQTQWERNL